MTDIKALKALAEAAIRQHEDWKTAGEPFPAWNTQLMEMYAAANPAAVLELIAELEKIRADRNACWEEFKFQGRQHDHLRIEVADLGMGIEAAKEEIALLKAENEALRKDAKRYRFLRNQHCPVAYLAVVVNPKVSVKLGHDCPSGDRLDEQVDGAMKREASHD